MDHAPLEDLFLRYRDEGDLDALGQVFTRAQPQLTRIAERLTGKAGVAEDAVQATFLVLLERADRFEAGRPLMPWLNGILANRVRELHASRNRQLTITIGEHDAAVQNDSELTLEELRSIVDRTLKAMPVEYRDVLYLSLRQEMAPVDISATLGRPRGTVRSQLARGLERLRQALPPGLATALIVSLMPRRGEAAMRALVLHAAAASRPRFPALLPILGVAVVCVVGGFMFDALQDDPEHSLSSIDYEEETVALPSRAPAIKATASVETSKDASEALVEEPSASSRMAEVVEERGSTASVRVRLLCRGTENPVPSAAITLLRTDDNTFLRQAITDANGLAEFDGLQPAKYDVHSDRNRVSRSGFASVNLERGASQHVVLRTARGVDLSGRVVDGDGRPIAGAVITLGWLASRPNGVARSGPDGTFKLLALADGFYLGARRRDFVPTALRRLEFPPGATKSSIELVIATPGGRVRGTVRFDDGRPCPGAVVLIGKWKGDPVIFDDGARGFGPPGSPARCDAAGQFDLSCVNPGTRRVLAYSKTGPAKGTSTFRGHVEVLAGEATQLDISLVQCAVLRAVVRDADGQPLPGVDVYLGSMAEGTFQRDTTNADGVATVRGIAPGEHDVTLHGPTGVKVKALTFAPGETLPWEARIYEGRGIDGVVLDAAGNLLPGRTVRAHTPGSPVLLTTSKSDGSFRIESRVDEAYRLEVLAQDGQSADVVLDGVRLDKGPLTLRLDDALERTARVRGRVSPEASGGEAAVQLAAIDMTVDRRVSTSASDGSFDVPKLAPGRYVARAWRGEGAGPWRGPFALARGEERDLGDLAALPLLARGGIWAVIRDSAGLFVVVPKNVAAEVDPTCTQDG